MENQSKKVSLTSRRYLGSKTRLLPFIHQVFNEEGIVFNSFLDLFGGTGSVAFSFNDGSHSIIVNDILESNRSSFNAFFGNEQIDTEKIHRLLKELNDLQAKGENYFSKNFSGTFFSANNSKRIGAIRDEIDKLFSKGTINQREKDYLITALLYAMDRIANTVGHYDAFRRGGDLSKTLTLYPLDIPAPGVNHQNQVFKMDANQLAKKVEADVVYIDPPYNSRQYCDAYHLLENVATWKKPQVFGVARKMDRSGLKSRYCETSAPRVFHDLIQSLKCKYIVVSYNNMGEKGAGRSQAKISDIDIVRSLEEKGQVTVHEIAFNQFTTGKSHIDDHKERLFVCRVGETKKPEAIDVPQFVKSPLNYTGGKYKLLGQITRLFPDDYKTFVDLFGGGFNVGANINCDRIVYNDVSEPTMRVVKLFYAHSSNEIIRRLENLIQHYGLSDSQSRGYEFYGCSSDKGLGQYNKTGFKRLRDDYNACKRGIEKDYLLLLLIIFAFNNQIRFNSLGEYNLPVGKRDLNSMMRRHIQLFSEKIRAKRITFFSKDFATLKPAKFKDAFYYCDPPYILGDASYNENGGWTKDHETRLLSFLKEISDQGSRFALSNVIEHKGEKHQLLIDWAINNRFTIHYLNKNYSNSNYQIKDKAQQTVEVLVTNY